MDLLYEEQPVPFFDSHPEPAPGLLWKAAGRFKQHMITAWTGKPYWQVSKGQLRLLWYTSDGKEGTRDFELHEAETVRAAFTELSHLPEVSRVMVLGFPSQNPFTMHGVEDPKRALLQSGPQDFISADKKFRNGVAPPRSTTPLGKGVGFEIDSVIDAEARKEKERGERSYGQQEV